MSDLATTATVEIQGRPVLLTIPPSPAQWIDLVNLTRLNGMRGTAACLVACLPIHLRPKVTLAEFSHDAWEYGGACFDRLLPRYQASEINAAGLVAFELVHSHLMTLYAETEEAEGNSEPQAGSSD